MLLVLKRNGGTGDENGFSCDGGMRNGLTGRYLIWEIHDVLIICGINPESVKLSFHKRPSL